MAAAKECDICGKLYPYVKNAKYNAIRFGKVDSTLSWSNVGMQVELCPECLDAVNRALRIREEAEKNKELAQDGKKITDEY